MFDAMGCGGMNIRGACESFRFPNRGLAGYDLVFSLIMQFMGKLYLIPTPLGETASWDVALPAHNRSVLDEIDYFVVENIRTARRFLVRSGIARPIDALTFAELNEHSHPEEVEGLTDEEVQAFDAQFFVEEAAALDMTLEEYLSLRLDRGTVSVALGNLEPGAGYCAYGYGLTADGTVTSVMERRPFVTLSSDEPFVTVSFGSIGPDEAEVTFTPADDEITYVFDIRPAEDYLAMSDAECIEDIISAGVSEDMIRTGEYTHVFDGLTPETEYIVFAFGYDVPSGQTITSLARELFESTSGMLPDFSIEVRVENITASSADIFFIPSDKNASYFYDVLPAAAYEGMSDS